MTPTNFWGKKREGHTRKPPSLVTNKCNPPYKKVSGGVLLSHTLPSAVPSAQSALASGFGM